MGINGSENGTVAELQLQLAEIIEKAIEAALAIQAGPQGLDDIAIDGIALDAAESMIGQFDIFPKGELREETMFQYSRVDGGPELVRESRLVSGWTRADK